MPRNSVFVLPMGAIVLVSICATRSAAADSGLQQNSIGIQLVHIEPDSFEMGVDSVPLPQALIKSPPNVIYDRPTRDGDYDEVPVHKVTITQPFLIGMTEVTVDQYRQFKAEYKASSFDPTYAAGVSWDDAMAFCKWLSDKEGKPYRLPTEAEWEYACRAGTTTPFSSGATAPPPESANPWGVKNMHTNVAEWCLDWHGIYPRDPQTDPVGPAAGIAKVVRGGGLDFRDRPDRDDAGHHYPAEMPYYARSANRASVMPSFASADGNIGFRVVQAPMPQTSPTPYQQPFFQSAVKQQVPSDLSRGPDPDKPFYRTRPLFPNLGDKNMREVGWKIGFAPGLGTAYHNSAVQMCPNGDLVAAYYNTLRYENDPDQTILTMRLRYGADDWDMPDPWPDFADAADAAPVFWNDGTGRMWLFFGSPRLLAGPPFQFMTSLDSGATWTVPQMPNLTGPVGQYTPQPINSVVRDRDGTIFLPVDGHGGQSVLFATRDDGKTWSDTGGRTGGRHTTFVLGKDGSLIGFGGKNTNIDGFMPKSITRDGGKTYELSKTPFPPLNSGQRPSVIRLASGRLFFVADAYPSKPRPHRPGAYVAISDDDGQTWQRRDLPPDIATVGYCTATQTPNGLIHIVTSKNAPPVEIDMNEAWILHGGAPTPTATSVHDVQTFHESYPDGKPKAQWSGGIGDDGLFHLDGEQTFFYESGGNQWQATFAVGRKTGDETRWAPGGQKIWNRSYGKDGTWTWRIYTVDGQHVVAESRWKGKDLIDYKIGE